MTVGRITDYLKQHWPAIRNNCSKYHPVRRVEQASGNLLPMRPGLRLVVAASEVQAVEESSSKFNADATGGPRSLIYPICPQDERSYLIIPHEVATGADCGGCLVVKQHGEVADLVCNCCGAGVDTVTIAVRIADR